MILDIAMPHMPRLDLQRTLRREGHAVPIIFITAQWDEALRPCAIDQGAVECLFKPFSDTALFEAIQLTFGAN